MKKIIILLLLSFIISFLSCHTKKDDNIQNIFLTKDKLESKTKEELKIIRNEIFARKGYIFKDSLLDKYFKTKEWYFPNKKIKLILSEKEKIYINLIKFVEKEKSSKNISSALKSTSVEFLKYIDKSLVFQETFDNNFILYAWVCDGDDKGINFSGTLYLLPRKNKAKKWQEQKYKEKIIDSINTKFTFKEIHMRYSIWAQITHKEYFLPLQDWVDNPCEYYKKHRVVTIYHNTKTGKYVKIEDTGNTNKILKIIDKESKLLFNSLR